MIRTQIQLTEDQNRRLRGFAAREDISLAEAVRRCVDVALQRDDLAARYERAAALVGIARDQGGATDLAAEHDAYLDDAFGS